LWRSCRYFAFNSFATGATGGNFTNAGTDRTAQTTAAVRAYWKKYGKLPFDERMMAVLNDPTSNWKTLREAAYNVAHLGEDRMLFTTMPEGPAPRPRQGANPVVAKFRNPTAAEAILDAMERDLKANRFENTDTLQGIEDIYLSALRALGDERITPLLEKRKRAQPSGIR
jgi:hypothetical protein